MEKREGEEGGGEGEKREEGPLEWRTGEGGKRREVCPCKLTAIIRLVTTIFKQLLYQTSKL